ncbi:SAC3 domain-containing protein 1-like [Elysia marginata]|uniref:SAC3 domain-containing protein 1-like n=1 Tax=Elysia marginata TaxID=1093978 RepID=A0AAV4HQ75_9GAST|nr:SAC3 domain-containing protein 1-like [Elysia marginata]
MEITSDSEIISRLRGTCSSMCPEKEMIMREREGLLSPFEVLSTEGDCGTRKAGRNRPRADRRKVVKQFSRPAAGRADADPAQLRPAHVLKDTVTYLFTNVVPQDHPAWSSVYEFVFDRLRAVRQDMVMQGIVGRDAISILEQVVRFHLFASYRLRDAEISEFDPVINKQHLLECLKRLLYLYKVTPGYHHEREEFEGIYLLDNLGDPHALLHCLGLPAQLQTSPLVRQCYKISVAFVLRNYSRALRLMLRLRSPMCLCAVNPHLYTVRINYLQILSAGYSVRNCKYPVEKLREQLALTSTASAIDLCSKCGLIDLFDHPDPNTVGYVSFNKSLFKRPQVEEVKVLPHFNLIPSYITDAIDASHDSHSRTREETCNSMVSKCSVIDAAENGSHEMSKPSAAQFDAVWGLSQGTPVRSHRGRGVRLTPQGDNTPSTPGRGRGRGRRKV